MGVCSCNGSEGIRSEKSMYSTQTEGLGSICELARDFDCNI